MRSVTTDKFIHDADISSEELKQSMFHEHISLCLHDLLESSSLHQNDIVNCISTYFIFKAIEDCYSSAVSCIFKSDKHLFLKMSQLDILSSQIMKHYNMNSILFNFNCAFTSLYIFRWLEHALLILYFLSLYSYWEWWHFFKRDICYEFDSSTELHDTGS